MSISISILFYFISPFIYSASWPRPRNAIWTRTICRTLYGPPRTLFLRTYCCMDSETFRLDFSSAHKLNTIKLVKATLDAINVKDLVGKYLLWLLLPPTPIYFNILRRLERVVKGCRIDNLRSTMLCFVCALLLIPWKKEVKKGAALPVRETGRPNGRAARASAKYSE